DGRALVGIHFFFQAEDGIRDFHVTGVQTCALPISPARPGVATRPAATSGLGGGAEPGTAPARGSSPSPVELRSGSPEHLLMLPEIGRASLGKGCSKQDARCQL